VYSAFASYSSGSRLVCRDPSTAPQTPVYRPAVHRVRQIGHVRGIVISHVTES
jgi:hypothetical protein